MRSSLSIYGHRGSAGTHPENTLVSFKAAKKAGAHGIELDVQLTKDGIPVVIHDERVDRTTNGVGWVKDFRYEELRKLDAGSNYSYRFRGEHIPTLEEVLTWIAPTSLNINIELKTGSLPYPGIEKEVIELLHHFELTDRSVISSFNHYSVLRCIQLDKSVETAILLTDKLVHPWEYVKNIGAHSIHIHYAAVDPYLLENTIKHDIPVRVFTVNNVEQMNRLESIGCDAIFTDFPAVAIKNKSRRQ